MSNDDEQTPVRTETPEQKQQRKAQQAQDGVRAMTEYRNEEMAGRERTAKLRARRRAREAKSVDAK